jgi:hypothetical protein
MQVRLLGGHAALAEVVMERLPSLRQRQAPMVGEEYAVIWPTAYLRKCAELRT